LHQANSSHRLNTPPTEDVRRFGVVVAVKNIGRELITSDDIAPFEDQVAMSTAVLQSLLSRLEAIFKEENTPGPSDQRVRECLLASSKPSSLVALLGLLPSDAAIDFAKAHENGFFRFDLHEPHSRAFRLRLHLWTELSRVPSNDVHNHTRDYWSVVLLGGLRVTQFERQARGRHRFFHYLASNESADGAYSFLSSSEISLRETISADVQSGEVHAQACHQLHQVAPLVVPTATLFLQGPERSTVTDVFSSRPKPPTPVKCRPLTSSDRESILQALDSLMGER